MLHGMIELDISFEGRTMKTPVYVKVDAPNQLLLGEGVCRQLQIISYHPAILSQTQGRRDRRCPSQKTTTSDQNLSRRLGPKLQGMNRPREEQNVGASLGGEMKAQETTSTLAMLRNHARRTKEDGRESIHPSWRSERSAHGQGQPTSPSNEAAHEMSNSQGGESGEVGQTEAGPTDPRVHSDGPAGQEAVLTRTWTEQPASAEGVRRGRSARKRTKRGPRRGCRRCQPMKVTNELPTLPVISGDTAEEALCPGPSTSQKSPFPTGSNIQPRNEDAVVPQTTDEITQTEAEALEMEFTASTDAVVPTIRVHLVQAIRVPARQWALAKLRTESELPTGPVVFQPNTDTEQTWGVYLEDSLLEPGTDGYLQVPVVNRSGFTQEIDAGESLGGVMGASVITAGESPSVASVLRATVDSGEASTREKLRQEKLKEAVGDLNLPIEEELAFQTFVAERHETFCLEDGERGETELVCMEIDTGDTHPIKQRVRRMPFALRQEVARQLCSMQESGVIQPSKSPWASPVVLVRKKDGSHRFCVDYRTL